MDVRMIATSGKHTKTGSLVSLFLLSLLGFLFWAAVIAAVKWVAGWV